MALSLQKASQSVPETLETYVREVIEDAWRLAKDDNNFQLKHFESIDLAAKLKLDPELLSRDSNEIMQSEASSKLLSLLVG